MLWIILIYCYLTFIVTLILIEYKKLLIANFNLCNAKNIAFADTERTRMRLTKKNSSRQHTVSDCQIEEA